MPIPSLFKKRYTEKQPAALAKDIKANRGVVSLPKLVLLLLVLGGIAAGYLLLKNRIAEKALEAGLEALFQAKADVRDLDFSLFSAKVSWARLQVADRDKPMTNLFEIGAVAADLDFGALLKGRIVVEKLEAKDLRWSTARTESGALEKKAEPDEKKSGPSAFGGLAGKAISSLSAVDPKELLDREADRLKTKKTAEKLNADAKALKEGWTAKAADTRKQVDGLAAAMKDITGVRADSIKSPEEALLVYNRISETMPKLQELQKTAEALKKDFVASLAAAEQGKADLDKALAADYAYVESLVKLSTGETASLAKELFADYAAESLGAWYAYGLRGIEIGKNLASGEPKEAAKKAETSGAKGRDIRFRAEKQPRFLLKEAAFSSGGAGGPGIEGRLANLSSDPDLAGGKTTFAFSYADGAKKTSADGSVDLTKAAAAVFEMRLASENLPLALSFPASALGVKNLQGPLSVKAAMTLLKEGGMKGSAEAVVKQPKVERSGGGGAVTDLVVSVLGGAQALDAKLAYAAAPGGAIELSASSSLDRLVKERLAAFLKDQERKYRDLVRKELAKRLEAPLAENETLRKGLAEIDKSLGGSSGDLAAYRKAADAKRAEIEKQVSDLRKKAADSLLKGTQKALPSFR